MDKGYGITYHGLLSLIKSWSSGRYSCENRILKYDEINVTYDNRVTKEKSEIREFRLKLIFEGWLGFNQTKQIIPREMLRDIKRCLRNKIKGNRV